MVTTLAEITARDWSPKLRSYGEVVSNMDDIAQGLRIIFSTPIGSQPLRRDFGSRWMRNIDKPYAVAQANIPLDLIEAARWEPRATIVAVRVSPATEIASMSVAIEWRRSDNANAPVQTLVLTEEQRGITSGADRIITEQIASASQTLNVRITDYRNEFLDALNN